MNISKKFLKFVKRQSLMFRSVSHDVQRAKIPFAVTEQAVSPEAEYKQVKFLIRQFL